MKLLPECSEQMACLFLRAASQPALQLCTFLCRALNMLALAALAARAVQGRGRGPAAEAAGGDSRGDAGHRGQRERH